MFRIMWTALTLMALILVSPMPSLSQEDSSLSPILIVPGLTGSQLDVRDEETLCSTGGESIGLWINLYRLSFYALCARRELELNFNSTGNIYTDKDRVTVTVPGFGETRTVQFLNTNDLYRIPYFNDFVNYFVARGYQDGVNIRAAPYDWRYAADNLQRMNYYQNLMNLIEEMYQQHGNRKVTIVVHSMGGPVSLHFLTGFAPVTQEWKDTHINAWITLSGAWSGGNVDLQAIISGVSPFPGVHLFGNFFSEKKYFVPIIRSLESTSWLLPRESIWGDKTLVSTPSRNYTANDYQQLFTDIGYSSGYQMYQGILPINPNFPAPNVPTYCFYGVGLNTVEAITYSEDFSSDKIPDSPTATQFGDGDSVVNVQSSEICLNWRNMGSFPFHTMTFSGVSHTKMVENEAVLQAIGAVVGASLEEASTCGAASMNPMLVYLTVLLFVATIGLMY